MPKKSPAGRITSPTNRYSKSYLAKAWVGRKDLPENERRGFAQFFYITICGHLESLIVSIIKARLRFVSTFVRWDELPAFKYEDDDGEHYYSLEPIIQSVKQISKLLEKEVEAATLSKLISLYARVFPDNLKKIIGTDLYDDIESLAVLRNIFAHGGDMFMEFEIDEGSTFTGYLDGNPLNKPVDRLIRAGVIKNKQINGNNHGEFHAIFYSDEAMLYFYKAVQAIETSLASASNFIPEQILHTKEKLPSLV